MGPEALTYARDRVQSLRAHVLFDEGRLADALAALESQPRRFRRQYLWDTRLYSHPEDRLLRGATLVEQGRYAEALRWYGTLLDAWSGGDRHCMAVAHPHFAEVYDRLGEKKNAAHHYARFIQAWRDCDPELPPQVEAAERALGRLELLVETRRW